MVSAWLSNEPAQTTGTKSDSNLITANMCHCCGGQVLDLRETLVMLHQNKSAWQMLLPWTHKVPSVRSEA